MVKLYRVGGSVRDEFLGVKSKDIDYAVEAGSYQEMVDYIKQNGKIYLETPQYFTVRAKLNGIDADFVLCRKDGEYKDGRRPETVEVGDIYADLSRRDARMNSIAIDEKGNILDPHNGLQDIKDGIIRCVGDPEKRFNEDALRMLRMVRFAITKNMVLDDEIDEFLSRTMNADMIGKVSAERVKDELNKCFMFDMTRSFDYMKKYHILFDSIFYFHKNLRLKATMEERF